MTTTITSRRRVTGLAASVVLLAGISFSCSGGTPSAQDRVRKLIGGPDREPDGRVSYNLTIAFTNDIHAQALPTERGLGGLARHARVIAEMRDQAEERGVGLFLANAGDNFEGSLFHEGDGGALVFRLLEAMGYDVVQIGNHDHQFGVQRIFDVLEAAFPGFQQNVQVLWGNVNPSRMSPLGTDPTMAQAPFVPAQVEQRVIDAFENAFMDFDLGLIDPALMDPPLARQHLFNQTLFFDVNGIRLGVVGLDTDEILYNSVPGEGGLFLDPDGRSENLRFYDPVDHTFASEAIDFLDDPDGNPATDDGADILIAVTHVGVDGDLEIARNAVGPNSGRRLDVIVGGHSHDRINTDLVVDHAGGGQTHIVQAGERGEFIGRIDLDVDPAANTVVVRNAELIQIDSAIPDDPIVSAALAAAVTAPGGLNDRFDEPFSTALTTSTQPLPGGVPATSSLGSLAADACLSVGNQPPHSLGLDAVVLGNFVFRAGLAAGPLTAADAQAVLPLHALDRSGLDSDSLEFVDLPGGLREALDPSGFPIPNPNLTNITALEYLLELIYGIEDILSVLGNFLGIDIGSVTAFINGLQWSGIEFAVDTTAPPLHRIDPASIVVAGTPLVGNEGMSVRLGLNAIVTRIALPFFQLLALIEDPPGSSILVPFPDYDEATNGTDLVVWEALRDHLATITVLDSAAVRVTGDRPRTVAPDLTFNPPDVILPPTAAPREMTTIAVPIINIGETAVNDAMLTLLMDLTPRFVKDDPDGFTDLVTGFTFPVIGTASVGPVPAYANGAPGLTMVNVDILVPPGLDPGSYPIFVRTDNVVSADPTRPEVITANNGGTRFPLSLSVR